MPGEEKFLGANWLLDTKEAAKLYHEVAVTLREELGIVDTHTHHNLRQIVENHIPLLSRFFSGETSNQSHLILYPMNQTWAHVNVMLERAFPNVHAGFPWWHNDTPHVMEEYLLHAASASLLTSSGGPVCDGRKILSEGSRFEVFDRVICRAVGKLISDGRMSEAGGIRAMKALMYENQARLFHL